jgi:hypothetical protein
VKALDKLVPADGSTITIDDHPKPRPLSAEEKSMIAEVSKRRSEAQAQKSLSVQHWMDDLPWEQANERLESQPRVNVAVLKRPGRVLRHRVIESERARLRRRGDVVSWNTCTSWGGNSFSKLRTCRKTPRESTPRNRVVMLAQ